MHARLGRGSIAAILASAVLHPSIARANDFKIVPLATGLNQPTEVVQAPGDDTDLYIVQKLSANATAGGIFKYNTVTHTGATFLNLSSNPAIQDGGALSMAFSPDFQSNGLFFVAGLYGLTNHVDEYKVVNGSPVFQKTILQYNNLATQHTVDWLGFAPSASGAARNYVYITTGDGGIQADSSNGAFHNNGQDLTTVFGKVLRVDVSGPDSYPNDPNKNFAIPPINPYAGQSGKLGEIWVSGLRNPYRASFDRATGDLYIGDVGFNTNEEVDFVKAGASGEDFGWASREGTIATPVNGVGAPRGSSINPILQYSHNGQSKSITGGIVYRGPVASLDGQYLYADFVDSSIHSFAFDTLVNPASFNGNNIWDLADRTSEFRSLVQGGGSLSHITDFGEDNAGNLLLVSFTDSSGNIFNPPLGTGAVYEIVPVPDPISATMLLAMIAVCRGRGHAGRCSLA